MLITQVNESDLVQRYFVVDHPYDKRKIGFDAKGAFTGVVPIHNFLHSYHWAEINANHVMIIGRFHNRYAAHLHGRNDTSVLPSIHSSKHLSTFLKPRHWQSVKTFYSLQDTDRLGDVIDAFVLRHGHTFSTQF